MKPLTVLAFGVFVVYLAAGQVPNQATADQALVTANNVRQARLLIDNGQFSKALEVLGGHHPSRDPELLYLRGYTLYRLNNLDAAKLQLKSALQIAPSNLQSRYILGRIAQQQNRALEAVHWLEPCALANPPVEDAVDRLGQLYWKIGQVTKARTWTEKATAIAPWNGNLHYRLGRIFQQLSEKELAQREFAKSIEAKTADSQGVQSLLDCSRALATGDLETALKIRREFLNRPDMDPDLLVALGTSFATTGAPAQALDLYKSAVERDSTSFQANFNLGLVLLNLDRPAEAVKPLQESLVQAPESKQANATLALAYVAQGKFSEAVTPLKVATAADPRDQKIAGLLSLAYSRSGESSKAIPILRHLVENEKDDPKLYYLLVDCLNETQKQQDALVIAEETVRRFPQLAKSWLSEAQQLARLGRYHEARPLFARAAELAPEQIEPLLGLAEAEGKDGDYETSFVTYQRAIAKDNDITAVLGAAKDLVFLGRMADARALLEHSASDNLNNSQVHIELSRVYARMGEKSLAEEQTRIVQRLRIEENQPRDRDQSARQ